MIAFVSGQLMSLETGERCAAIVLVQGIGYRVKIVARHLTSLPELGEEVHFFTHLLFRDPEWFLYGFASAPERDLFVELIKVTGIGAAMAMSLLNTLSLSELVQAIVSENIRVLALTPGVGTKTAQRLALELKAKLASWHQDMGKTGIPLSAGGPPAAIRTDIEIALVALGYHPNEMQQAFQQVTVPADTIDAWLRAVIAYLS